MISNNLGSFSHRFQDMASFLLNKHFSYPLHSAQNLELFPLHYILQILYAESVSTGLTVLRFRFSLPTLCAL